MTLRPELAAEVVARATRPDSPDHGEQHWKAVAWTGLMLADEIPRVDRELVVLFALFHDSQRHNEYHDPGHGVRGAELATTMCEEGAFDISTPRLRKLYDAIAMHDTGGTATDRSVAVMWDADRLNLWRVGTEPNPTFLSTWQAQVRIEEAQAYPHGHYDWATLFTQT